MIQFDSEQIQEMLSKLIPAAQQQLQEDGVQASSEVLTQAFVFWLESSVEELLADALFHCIDSDRPAQFNRGAFQTRLAHLMMQPPQPQPQPQPQPELVSAQ